MLCTVPMDRAEAMAIRNQQEISRAVSKAMAANGAKGGRAAAANMTPEQRKERARKAALAREARRKERLR